MAQSQKKLLHEEQHTRKIEQLEQSRNNDLKKVIIDAVKRDQAEGYNYDYLIYVAPGINPDEVEPSIQRACIDVFGHHRDPEKVEIFMHDGKSEKIGVQMMGRDVTCVSYGVTIKWPKSQFYRLEQIRDQLLKRIHHHLA